MPSSYFSYEQQTVKGPRANTDVGTPTDASRPFVKGIQGGTASCGSWGCTEGGWLSPKPRTSTEWFYVLAGRGSVQTPDGREFSFGPGDLVVLPRGWAGRWDVQERIHKIWVVHEHEDIPGANAEPVVVARNELFREKNDVVGSAAQRGISTYDVGATRAGSWMCSPGSFAVSPRPVAEVFVVVKGAMFLTNGDGSARRCGVGDVVHLPEMWAGRVDVVEEVATVFAEVAETGSRVVGEVDAKYAGDETRGVSSGKTQKKARRTETRRRSEPRRAARTRRDAGAQKRKPIYEVGAPVPVPSWGWGASSPASAESDKAKYEVCLAVLENSDDPELVAAAKARLLKYLE